MTSSDVLIVGAGPVGLLAALALAHTGAKVTVLEQEPEIVNSPRAAVYFPASLVALNELGILDDLLKIGFCNRAFGTHVPEFGYHSVIISEEIPGIPYEYQLHAGQHQVAQVAMEHAQRLGVEVLFGHAVTALEQDDHGVTVTANGAQHRAQWLIGADGARSTVRTLAGIDFPGMTWPERFIATNVYFPFAELGFEQANFVCDPVNMAIIALLDREGLWRCTFTEDAALPLESLEKRIHQRYEHFMAGRKDYRIGSFSPYMLHQRAAETLVKGRVTLAGDAAHATNPCGGLGLTSGLWTGLVLADLLGAILKGEVESDVLVRFSDERRRIFWDIVTPAATENKRMLMEADPAKRQQDLQHIQALQDNPDSGAMLMLFAYKVIGDTIRPGSRWADADPTPRVAPHIANRKGQIH